MKNDGSELNSTEAIFAFMSWLSTRDDTISIGGSERTTPIVERLTEFMAENPGLPDCRENYTELYSLPVGQCSEV